MSFKWMFHLLLLLACGVLHAQQQGTVTYVYTDPQGTPLAEADANGNITATYDYAPYGSIASYGTGVGGPPNGPGYTGHVSDPETNLVYMQARYYDPATGRFLSVDPVAPKPSDSFGFNRYNYSKNNPIINVDPDGRTVTCDQNACHIHATRLGELMIDYVVVATVYTERAIQNTINSTPVVHNETQGEPTPLPGGLVGQQDGKTGQQGKRINNGPLAPSNGGTGDAEKDFDNLTGGKSSPAPTDKGYPAGTLVGDNGISYRPGTDKTGPRIDIPANGNKPPETLHYPTPPPPPPPPPSTQQ
ncbi:MAG TPA: RHS repeat-associated core domain-containing protein [Dyella sp.]|uniref:RHS repeat-associated core domain-containing protein n=1 Tax=Dyella sp. TaxID=1869338 RepID=UPI002BE041D3|nr:RHS repeat-associated core domain-containing protein [Dyella sp.]HTV86200.1 RHS repeat-associated core domain-containing protein [Dyella sp.]